MADGELHILADDLDQLYTVGTGPEEYLAKVDAFRQYLAARKEGMMATPPMPRPPEDRDKPA